MKNRSKNIHHLGLLIINLIIASLFIMTPVQSADNDSAPKLRGPAKIKSTKSLNFKVNYVYRPAGQGDLRPLKDGATLKSGDHYKIQFTPQENGYVYIFQIDSSDTVYQLFPMDEWSGVVLNNHNPVRAGTTYHLPADDKSFVLDDQRGLETIYFLASREDDPNVKKLAQQLHDARQQNNSQLDSSTQRALKQTFKTRGPAKIVSDSSSQTEINWNKQEKFKVSEQRLNCANCINEVTFSHE